MFGLGPDVIQFIAYCLLILYYGYVAVRQRTGTQSPVAEEMVVVVNWERVAKLEHDLGYDHTNEETQGACRHEDCYTPPADEVDDMPFGDAVDTASRVLGGGAATPNELRATLEVLKMAVNNAVYPGSIDTEPEYVTIQSGDGQVIRTIQTNPYAQITARNIDELTEEDARNRGYDSSEQYRADLRRLQYLERR